MIWASLACNLESTSVPFLEIVSLGIILFFVCSDQNKDEKYMCYLLVLFSTRIFFVVIKMECTICML